MVGFIRVSLPMLVLTRLPGDSVLIGDEVEITLVEIQGSKVRIGIGDPTTGSEGQQALLSPDETISIGSNIEVLLVDITGNIARLGITAPQEVGIRRG